MYIISSGITTVLSDFADLETKSSYAHKKAEKTDFQFYRNSGIFVEMHQKAGLEVMRIKETNANDLEIQRIRKLKVENANCVACANKSIYEIALGLNNGQVRVYDYRKTEFLNRYDGDKRNSVNFLDYNSSDEYIAAVLEHGLINVYGTKTSVRLESITIDSSSTLARFHPIKPFHLAVASYRGAVTAYDIHSKRQIFHSADSHSAPCRDLCMSMATPDTLISVGFDCVINIFDIRRKGTPIKLNHNHPLSTVSQSDCGNFFCVGNLKGELATFDMRNPKMHLSLNKVHDIAVNRVAFVPTIGRDEECTLSVPSKSISNTDTIVATVKAFHSAPQTVEFPKSDSRSIGQTPLTTLRNQRDSFCDFFDIQGSKGIEKTSSRQTANAGRDSFDWEVFTRKKRTRTLTNILNSGSSLNITNGIINNARTVVSFGDSFEDKSNNSSSNFKDSKSETESHVVAPLREQNVIKYQQASPLEKLKSIKETQPLDQAALDTTMSNSSGSDKENPRAVHMDIENQKEKSNDNGPTLNDSQKIIDYIRSEMDARLHELESNVKENAERNKWEIFTQSFELWQKQINHTEEIRSALGVLLQTDPFVVEFRRLKEENKALKEQLEYLKNIRK